MEKIKKELLELGFCINSKGIFYWIDLIKLAKEKPNMEITKMYIELAKMNKTSYTSIERCCVYFHLRSERFERCCYRND